MQAIFNIFEYCGFQWNIVLKSFSIVGNTGNGQLVYNCATNKFPCGCCYRTIFSLFMISVSGPATSLSIWLTSFRQIRTQFHNCIMRLTRNLCNKEVVSDLSQTFKSHFSTLPNNNTILDTLPSTRHWANGKVNVCGDFSAATNKWYTEIHSVGTGYEKSILKAGGIRIQSYDHKIFI